jgi:hypothetical protein
MTRGLSAVNEPDVAVCILPGTELAFEKKVEFEPLGASAGGTAEHRLARFRQVDLDHSYAHHDALEFPDGQRVLVTRLRIGQRVRVLQLPSSGRAVAEAEPGPAEADTHVGLEPVP